MSIRSKATTFKSSSQPNWKKARHSSPGSPRINRCSRYSPEKWSIRQVLNHISDTERSMAFRAFWFGRNFSTPLPNYDQNIAASAAEADRISWAAHIEEFRRVRLATISLIANMPSEGWMRTGVASDNLFTVRALAYIIAGHYAYHVKILSERYL